MIPTLYEPFRHWSEGGSVYILSDLHFDDSDCKLMDPGWITPQEQLAIINKNVMKGDTFVCLGDVGAPEYVKEIKARKKILILGNHDAKGAYTKYFDEIYAGPIFIAEKILLSHEPVYGLEWCLNIHGHDHTGAGRKNHLNCCVDGMMKQSGLPFEPINMNQIMKTGLLSKTESIHRLTIDTATEKKEKRKKKLGGKK